MVYGGDNSITKIVTISGKFALFFQASYSLLCVESLKANSTWQNFLKEEFRYKKVSINRR